MALALKIQIGRIAIDPALNTTKMQPLHKFLQSHQSSHPYSRHRSLFQVPKHTWYNWRWFLEQQILQAVPLYHSYITQVSHY